VNQLGSFIAGPAPGLGHNRPPEVINQVGALTHRLAGTYGDLVARFLDLELGCARVPHPIQGEEDASLATDFIAQCQVHTRDAEAAHKREKEFFLKAGRAVDAFFKRRCETLSVALVPVVSRLKTYHDQVVEAERRRHEVACRAGEEEACRATEEAGRYRAEAERLVGEAMNAEDRRHAAEHLILAEQAEERAEKARLQASTSLEPTRIRGDYGATAYVSRTWAFEVIDLGQVPREYVSLDVAAVREAINKDRARNIPGLRIFPVESLRVRGAA